MDFFCRSLSAAHVLLLIDVLVMAFLASSVQAYTFYVGGREGWVLSPSESYNHWAERNRFQVNDTLVFKYRKGEDLVLLVNEEDFDTCYVKNPIEKMADGESSFKFDRPGPFYFVSGVPLKCRKAQKLHIRVLSPRTRLSAVALPAPPSHPPSPATTTPRSPDPSPSPTSTAKAPSPSTPLGGWFVGGISPAPSPASTPGPISTSTVLSLSRVTIGVMSVILVGVFVG